MKCKWTAMILVLVMTVALFAGCGKTDSNNDTAKGADGTKASSSESKTSDEKITLRVMTRIAGNDPKVQVFERVLDQFMEDHPNVTIQNDSVAEEGAYNNKLRADIATGNPPNLFYYPGAASVVAWAENNVIMNLDEIMTSGEWFDGFSEGAFGKWNLSAYGVEGHYGIPYAVNPEVVYYNKSLFEQAGIKDVPETMEEFYEVIEQLNSAGILPLATGAKDTWRTGHIFNNIIYKNIGVQGVVDLGARKGKWTDSAVVDSLQVLKDLKAMDAFQTGFEGIDYNTEKAMFHNGQAAMSIDGAWQINSIIASGTEHVDDISFFPFPYFEGKPEFENDLILFGPAYFLSGVATGAEKEMQIELGKYLTGKEVQQIMANEASEIVPRVDVTAPSDAHPLFQAMMSHATAIKVPGGDYSDYDTAPELLDKSRDAIIGMLINGTAEDAAAAIQESIDTYEKNK